MNRTTSRTIGPSYVLSFPVGSCAWMGAYLSVTSLDAIFSSWLVEALTDLWSDDFSVLFGLVRSCDGLVSLTLARRSPKRPNRPRPATFSDVLRSTFPVSGFNRPEDALVKIYEREPSSSIPSFTTCPAPGSSVRKYSPASYF